MSKPSKGQIMTAKYQCDVCCDISRRIYKRGRPAKCDRCGGKVFRISPAYEWKKRPNCGRKAVR